MIYKYKMVFHLIGTEKKIEHNRLSQYDEKYKNPFITDGIYQENEKESNSKHSLIIKKERKYCFFWEITGCIG